MTLELWTATFLFTFSLLWFRDEPPKQELKQPPAACLVIPVEKRELVLIKKQCIDEDNESK